MTEEIKRLMLSYLYTTVVNNIAKILFFETNINKCGNYTGCFGEKDGIWRHYTFYNFKNYDCLTLNIGIDDDKSFFAEYNIYNKKNEPITKIVKEYNINNWEEFCEKIFNMTNDILNLSKQ